MSDNVSKNDAVKRRWIGPLLAWLLIAYVSAAMLFMCSGAMAHGAKPLHPTAGNIGWILAGLSPVIAYISYLLLARRYKSKLARWLIVFLALGVFLVCQFLGFALLRYALPGQELHLG